MTRPTDVSRIVLLPKALPRERKGRDPIRRYRLARVELDSHGRFDPLAHLRQGYD
jgi:hypothetical protein